MKPQEPGRAQKLLVLFLMNTRKNEAINYELRQNIFISVSYFSGKESGRYFIVPRN
jgi:hypothetical protein